MRRLLAANLLVIERTTAPNAKRRTAKTMKILAINSDMHVNSAVGLLPPNARLDSGQEVKQSKSQAWMWERWLGFWRDAEKAASALKSDIVSVINGDWGDIIRLRNGAQLIEHENKNVVMQFMKDATKPMRDVTDDIIVNRGTEAHTGGAGWLEEKVSSEIEARKDPLTGLSSFWVLRLQVEGVRFLIAHHPMTNGRVKWTLGSAANRAAASVALDYYNEEQKPDAAIFGHVHHSEDSFDNQPVRAIYTPPWCLANSYTHRLGAGLAPVEKVGGLIIVVDGNSCRVFKRYFDTPREEEQWLKI